MIVQTNNQTIAALSKATMAVSSDLALRKVLRQIVDSARELVQAQYGALGVPNGEGVLIEFVHSGISAERAAMVGHLPRGLGLLGTIVKEGRTIRIPNIRKDPRMVGFPAHHPEMSSFLGVPIKSGREVLGNLYLTNKMGAEEFSAEDQVLIELLAAHAAIAIRNARLYEEVARLAIIEERSRIGMDLHDGVIQEIYAVGLILETSRMLLNEDHEQAGVLIARAIDGLNNAIRDIRNFILDLRPRRFQGDLQQGLAQLVREFQANTMVPVEMTVAADMVARLPLAVARALFLSAQEALANIARHAQASRVRLSLAPAGTNGILLQVEDDGVGFEVESQVHQTGHGLANMRARTEAQSGFCFIHSVPGRGTTIRLTFPLHLE